MSILSRPLSTGPWIAGVRLDARDDADVVGFGSVAIEVNRITLRGAADLHDLHRRAQRDADELLGDAVAFEQATLFLPAVPPP